MRIGSKDITIRLEAANQPDVLSLIEALDAYQKPLYPLESFHGCDVATLVQANVLFAVVRNADGVAVGCGAIALYEEYGEIKRMFVTPSARGAGIARKLLAFLEDAARAKGCSRFMLETGYLQREALSLYVACGYKHCGPFGSYSEDPNSVYMGKDTVK